MAETYYPEEMYNLPYEQAKAMYGGGVGNNIQHFMSKDQFEQEKARIEKQNKMAVNEGKSDWWTQPGEAEKIVERFTGKANPTKEEVSEKANEIIERRITPEQQGTLAKGNPDENKFDIQDDIYFTIKDKIDQGKNQINKIIDKITGKSDNIDDTRAIGATKEELDYMLQNGLISKDAYDKQIAALKTPEVQEAMDRGEKKADETVWDPTDRDASDDDDDDDGGGSESGPDENYKKSMMSIWDAYRAGLIDKETAGYFTIDAIATLAKNLGRSIGNVGAQFSGGTIDNGHDESKWGQRQNAVLNEEIGKETESLGGAAGRKAESESLDNQAKRIRNAYTPKQLEQQIEMFEKELEMAGIDLDMAHSRTDLINFIKSDPNYANSPFKMGMVAYLTQNGVGGAVNNASSTLLDAMNWMLTIAK